MTSEAATLLRDAREALVARGDASATGRAIAHRWGISHAIVDRMSDSTSGVAIALGDLLAMPRTLAIEVLTGALASLDESADVPTVRPRPLWEGRLKRCSCPRCSRPAEALMVPARCATCRSCGCASDLPRCEPLAPPQRALPNGGASCPL